MLFDLEDYRVWGIIGPSSISQENINWTEAYQTFKIHFVNYGDKIKSYVDSSMRQAKMSDRLTLLNDEEQIWIKYAAFGRNSKTFWHALISKHVQFNEGDKFYIYDSYEGDDRFPGSVVYPKQYPLFSWYPPKRAIASTNEFYDTNWDSNFVYDYIPFTQSIFTSYKTALVEFQAAVKQFITDADGEIVDYVAPAIPAWNEYPELSGYVKAHNYLAIQGAVVNLVDAQGDVHSVVTDSKGYYKFSKEFIYNNIALDSTEIGSFQDFNMYISEETESGVVLYDSSDKYQSSFVGSVNDRGLEWPVRLKMNKPNRQNFRLEVIPNYSNYPSFKGHVYDKDGNPVQNAFVMVREPNSGEYVGRYVKPNPNQGNYTYYVNFKYNDFGVTKTILTDENGYYEYTSQMVGEWFNNQYASELGISPEMLTNPSFSFNDGTVDRMSNELTLFLATHKQNSESDSITGDGELIYNQGDYLNSRFPGSISQIPYYTTAEMGQTYTTDINITLIDAEAGAEKLYASPKLDIYQSFDFSITTTTGYLRVKKWDDTYELIGWEGMENQPISSGIYAQDGNLQTNRDLYIYSCDQHGIASGHITNFYIDNVKFDSIGLTELTGLGNLTIGNNPIIEEIDLTGLDTITTMSIHDCTKLKLITGLETLSSLVELTLEGNFGTQFSRSTTEFIYEFDNNWPSYVNPYGFDSAVTVLKKLPDGKLIAGGAFRPYNSNGSVYDGYGIAKLNEDLSIDGNFEFNIGSGFDSVVTSINILNDGKILVGGSFDSFNNQNTKLIARLNGDGTLDSSFNFSAENFNFGEIHGINVLSDGKILVNGYFNINGLLYGLLILNNDGSLYNAPLSSSFNYINTIYSAKFQSNGKLIIFGEFSYDNNGVTVNGVARINSDFTIDMDFANNLNLGFTSSSFRLEIQSDDKILISGSGYMEFGNGKFCRLNSDGTLDTNFNNNFPSIEGEIYAIHVNSEGDILLGGCATSINGISPNSNYVYTMFIVNSDGTLKSKDFAKSQTNNNIVYGFLIEGNDIFVYGSMNWNGIILNNKYIEPRSLYKLKLVGAPIYELNFPSSIEILSVYNNYWVKNLDFSELSNLKVLEFSGFYHIETLNLSGLANLENLYISDGNSETSNDLVVIGEGTDLSTLQSFHFQIYGSGLVNRLIDMSSLDFSNTPNLAALNLVNNTASSNVLNSNLNLENGDFSSLYLKGNFCETLDLSGCDNLINLHMENSSTNLILSGLSSASQLSDINLQNLSGTLTIQDLSNLTALTSINISNISGNTELTIHNNNVSYINITYTPILETLNIQGNNLSTVQIVGLDDLTSLNVLSTSLTNLITYAISNLTSLDLSNIPNLSTFEFSGFDSIQSINMDGLDNLNSITISSNINVGSLDLTQIPNLGSLSLYNFTADTTSWLSDLVANGKNGGYLGGNQFYITEEANASVATLLNRNWILNTWFPLI